MHDVDCITWGCDLFFFFAAASWIGGAVRIRYASSGVVAAAVILGFVFLLL